MLYVGSCDGAATLLVICVALFSVEHHAIVILAPVTAVFGSAYFLLLLDAKKLHPVYSRTAIAVLVVITAWTSLSAVIWKAGVAEKAKSLASTMLLKDAFNGIMYTDTPWAVAWRTSGIGVWLPRNDDDVYELDARGLPLRSALLTPECANYAPTETWFVIYRYQFWRDYLKDPSSPAAQAGISTIAAQQDMTVERVERGLREMKRQLPICESISGFTAERLPGLAPDGYIVVTCPPR